SVPPSAKRIFPTARPTGNDRREAQALLALTTCPHSPNSASPEGGALRANASPVFPCNADYMRITRPTELTAATPPGRRSDPEARHELEVSAKARRSCDTVRPAATLVGPAKPSDQGFRMSRRPHPATLCPRTEQPSRPQLSAPGLSSSRTRI